MDNKKIVLNEVGFEHCHGHSMFSVTDGFGMPEEYAERAPQINQKFLCITDHGMMGAVPAQIRACEENNITPIFGIEYYYQPDHPNSKADFQGMDKEQKSSIRKSYHFTAIAHNETGFKNLVQSSSWSWTEGFYYKPRINKNILNKYKEGITFLSGCYNSIIGQAFDKGGAEAADIKIEECIKMFGEHFQLEIMLLDFHKQKPYNAYIIKTSEKYNLPIVCTQDFHYCCKEDSKYQRYMLMIGKKTTVADIEKKLSQDDKAEIFELQDQNLWMKSESELNEKWLESYSDIIPWDVFTKAKENSVKLCEKSKGVQLDKSLKLPQLPDADERFKSELFHGFKSRGFKGKREYELRLREEYDLIVRKGFSSYFLIQKQIIDEARRVAPSILGFGCGDEAVGPGRGSCAGSLACYCLGITDVDPIKHGLLFSRFLSENRGGKTIRTKFTKPPIKV